MPPPYTWHTSPRYRCAAVVHACFTYCVLLCCAPRGVVMHGCFFFFLAPRFVFCFGLLCFIISQPEPFIAVMLRNMTLCCSDPLVPLVSVPFFSPDPVAAPSTPPIPPPPPDPTHPDHPPQPPPPPFTPHPCSQPATEHRRHSL